MTEPARLMVIVPDRLTDLVRKGEITERYYNPGNLFDEVHLVVTNDDRPDPQALAKTIGGARLVLHNLPAGRDLFLRTLGWRPWLLKGWASAAVDLARGLRPRLVRCHGALLNAFAAHRIKADLGIPYVVSMHTNPDADMRGMASGFKERLFGWAARDIERVALRDADLVMPVYRDIVPYLERLGVTRYEVCYNALNPGHLGIKSDYRLHDPVRVVSVGRQTVGKNPENLVRAIGGLRGMHLTLIGDGDIHGRLREVAAEAGVSDRVEFIASLPNDELCARLPGFDIFAAHNDYWGVPKAVLEPLIAGLPVVVNRRRGGPISELTDDICMLVEDTPAGWRDALARLAADEPLRADLGRRAAARARTVWSPAVTEAKFVEVYRRYARGV